MSHSHLLDRDSESDIVTEAKTLFQSISFAEKENMKALYKSSTQSITASLSNESMQKEVEERFVANMDDRINKNNLYVEVAYQEIAATRQNQNGAIILQPNFFGIGIDLIELWNRFVKHKE